jgi:2-polyprenyl-3-methyl-5-hydroxy-6-metoxy-1,4-benzoquinol methylase
MIYQPASEDLKRRVREFMDRNRGKLYHKIPHPDFDGLPVSHGDERFAILAPHLAGLQGRVLDIGTHWGQFAHWLEDMGFEVTAVEHATKHAYIAKGIRDICGKKFKVLEDSIFNVPVLKYDIIFALNIFHHFLKTESGFRELNSLLHRLDTPLLFFQTHFPEEKQMEGAYHNMQQDEFAEFVRQKGRFSHLETIGRDNKRNIYKLWR